MCEENEVVIKFSHYYKSSIESGVKEATSRLKKYPVEVGDVVKCRYDEKDIPDFYIKITEIKKISFNLLSDMDAALEGYLEKGLLKQVLKSYYPMIKDDTVIYQYKFEYLGVY
jgi:hypothetical protein